MTLRAFTDTAQTGTSDVCNIVLLERHWAENGPMCPECSVCGMPSTYFAEDRAKFPAILTLNFNSILYQTCGRNST